MGARERYVPRTNYVVASARFRPKSLFIHSNRANTSLLLIYTDANTNGVLVTLVSLFFPTERNGLKGECEKRQKSSMYGSVLICLFDIACPLPRAHGRMRHQRETSDAPDIFCSFFPTSKAPVL
jgi:hypothetical protein